MFSSSWSPQMVRTHYNCSKQITLMEELQQKLQCVVTPVVCMLARTGSLLCDEDEFTQRENSGMNVYTRVG